MNAEFILRFTGALEEKFFDMDMDKSERWQFLTRAAKNAHCTNSARIPYGGFSQIRSHM